MLPAGACVAASKACWLPRRVAQGILPSILAALMTARGRTREQLKATPSSARATRAVLDARQKALKLTANALYGARSLRLRY